MERIILAALIFVSFQNYAFMIPEWDEKTVYSAGDVVSFEGVNYVATHWIQGRKPEDNDNKWDGWVKLNVDNPLWDSAFAYNGGDVVLYSGDTYLAKYWNKNSIPSIDEVWVKIIGNVPDPDSDLGSDPSSKEVVLGKDDNNNGISDELELMINETYTEEGDIKLAQAAGVQWRIILEQNYKNEPVSFETAESMLYEAAFLYSCMLEKFSERDDYIPTTKLYFNNLERSYAYRMAEVKLLEAANYENGKELDLDGCDIYK